MTFGLRNTLIYVIYFQLFNQNNRQRQTFRTFLMSSFFLKTQRLIKQLIWISNLIIHLIMLN